MKIILATPLYPPEISYASFYVKELARALSNRHEIIVLTYGYIPEKVKNVKIYTVNKNSPFFIRIPLYFLFLWRISSGADVIYVQNGVSVELPAVIMSILKSTPLFLAISDMKAHLNTSKNQIMKFIENLARKQAILVVKNLPMKKPTISPFVSKNEKDWAQYEASWSDHINHLEDIFKNGKKL